MQAAVLRGNRQLTVESVPEPVPGPDEVLIEVAFTGICGTDLHEYAAGPMFSNPPVVMGHETAGTIVEVGSAVEGLVPGQRVTVIPMQWCGECHYCRRALYHLCDNFSGVGFQRDGAFAPLLRVPARLVVPVPDAVPLDVAALTEHFTVAFHAVRRARLQVGERVLVLGAGPVGLAVLQCAVAAGAGEVLVTEPAAGRAETAMAMGATQVLNPEDPDTIERVRAATDGIGADVVFDAVGSQAALDQGFACLRKRGRFAELAAWEGPAALDMNRGLMSEHEVLYMFGYEMYDDFPAVLGLMASGRLDAGRQITARIPLAGIVEQGVEPLLASRGEQVKVLVEPGR